MYLIYVGLVLIAVECTGQPLNFCDPGVNVGSQACNFEGIHRLSHFLAELKIITDGLVEQVAELKERIKDTEPQPTDSPGTRLSHLLAEQKNITDGLQERVAQLEERIRDTDCPVGYQRFQRTCYRFSTDRKPHRKARDTCHGEGGRLATVKDQETHDFLANHVRATTRANTWIGLTDEATEGSWVWDDGTSLVGDGIWGPYEPNGGTRENCADIYPSKNYRWNDHSCPSSNYYICEFIA
ncbi:perlucin-like protein isoform X2 [Branchiostoma floridae x Branchiostoma japonicum]